MGTTTTINTLGLRFVCFAMLNLRELQEIKSDSVILVDTPSIDSFVESSSQMEPIPALRIHKAKLSKRSRRLRRRPKCRRASLPSRWTANMAAVDEVDTMLTTRMPVRKTRSETVETTSTSTGTPSASYRRSASMDSSPILPSRRPDRCKKRSSIAGGCRSESSDTMPILPMRRAELPRQSPHIELVPSSEEVKSPDKLVSPSPCSRETRSSTPILLSRNNAILVESEGRKAFSDGAPTGYDSCPVMPKRKAAPSQVRSPIQNRICSLQA